MCLSALHSHISSLSPCWISLSEPSPCVTLLQLCSWFGYKCPKAGFRWFLWVPSKSEYSLILSAKRNFAIMMPGFACRVISFTLMHCSFWTHLGDKRVTCMVPSHQKGRNWSQITWAVLELYLVVWPWPVLCSIRWGGSRALSWQSGVTPVKEHLISLLILPEKTLLLFARESSN